MKKWILAGCLAFSVSLAAETKVLALSGSTRSGSYNKKLVEEAADVARKMGATVTVVDLKDFPMPFYDADLEKSKGMPENAKKLRNLMIKSDAIIIASPEYNGSVSGVLKNAIDWSSRSEDGNGSRDAFLGKKFALMSASPSKSGGVQGLEHLQFIVERLGGEVVKKEVVVPEAHIAANGQTALENPQIKQDLQVEVQQLLR